MKTKNAFFILIAFFLLLFSFSCASNLRPDWDEDPQHGLKKGMKGFIGSGSSVDMSEAKLLAYEDLASNISKYLGRDLSLLEIRELISSDSVQELGLSVINVFNVYEENVYYYSVQASAKLSVLESFRTDEVKLSAKRAQEVEELVLLGDECFKANQDVEGLRYYIESLCLSKNLDSSVEKEFRYDVILDLIKSILSNIRITVLSEDPSQIKCTLRVMRYDTILPSRVKNSPIAVFFNALDATSNIYEDKFVFTTDEKGDVYYYSVNANMIPEGSVKFTLDLFDCINKLKIVSPADAKILLDYLNNSTNYTFNYSKKYTNPLAVYSHEISINEDEDTENVLAEILVNKLLNNDYKAYMVSTSESFTTDIRTLNLLRKEDVKDEVIIIRSSLKDIISLVTGEVLATLEVEISLSRDEKEIKRVNFITSGVSNSLSNATKICYERFSDVAFSKLVVILDNRY